MTSYVYTAAGIDRKFVYMVDGYANNLQTLAEECAAHFYSLTDSAGVKWPIKLTLLIDNTPVGTYSVDLISKPRFSAKEST